MSHELSIRKNDHLGTQTDAIDDGLRNVIEIEICRGLAGSVCQGFRTTHEFHLRADFKPQISIAHDDDFRHDHLIIEPPTQPPICQVSPFATSKYDPSDLRNFYNAR